MVESPCREELEWDRADKYCVQVGRTEGNTIRVHGHRKAIATTGTWEPFNGSERVVVGNLGALTDGLAVRIAE